MTWWSSVFPGTIILIISISLFPSSLYSKPSVKSFHSFIQTSILSVYCIIVKFDITAALNMNVILCYAFLPESILTVIFQRLPRREFFILMQVFIGIQIIFWTTAILVWGTVSVVVRPKLQDLLIALFPLVSNVLSSQLVLLWWFSNKSKSNLV